MKKLLLILFLCVTSSQASQIVTATITVTNTPADGDTIIVNASTRTWKTTVATASSQISIGASIGANATNLFNQVAGTPFTTLTLARSGTNGITLRGIVDQAIAVTISGTWGSYSLSTNTVTSSSQIAVPFSAYPVQSTATNLASQLVSDIGTYSTNSIGQTATALSGFMNLGQTQSATNKTLISSTLRDGTLWRSIITNASIYHTRTNGGLMFFLYGGTEPSYALSAASNGIPSMYTVSLNASLERVMAIPSGVNPDPENLLIYKFADLRYGGLSGANSWTGTNTFARITNSVIVNSTISASTYDGTISALTNGTLYGSTITNGTYYGTVGLLTGGYLNAVGSTNGSSTNSTFVGTNQWTGDVAFPRVNNSSLANGNNAGVDFGAIVYAEVRAGPTAAFAICGIAGGRDGRMLIIQNNTTQNMTISNDSGVEPTAANRIYTNTGADVTSTGNGAVTLIWSAGSSRWNVIAWQP